MSLLGDTTGVVGHGAVCVGGQRDAERAEHADGGEGDAVQTGELEGDVDRGYEHEDRDGGGNHAEAKTTDDEGCCAGLGGLGQFPGWFVLVGRVVLGGCADELTGDEADEHGEEQLHRQAHDCDGDAGTDQHETAGGEDAGSQGPEQASHVCLLAGTDQEGADDSGADTNRHNQERQDERIAGVLRDGADVEDTVLGRADDTDGRQGHRRHDGAGVGLEQVGAHAGHVADVVTDVVGDCRRVTRVVLRDAGFDLTDEVGADVSGLGVDTTTDAGEEGNRGGAEGKAREGLHVFEDEVKGGEAEEADADHAHTHDDAGGERDAEGGIETNASLGGSADVSAHGDLHADEARQSRRACAHDVAEGRSRQIGELTCLLAEPVQDVVVNEDREDQCDYDYESGEEGVLTLEESAGALLNGVSDLLHRVVAFVLGDDRSGHVEGEYERSGARRQGDDQR